MEFIFILILSFPIWLPVVVLIYLIVSWVRDLSHGIKREYYVIDEYDEYDSRELARDLWLPDYGVMDVPVEEGPHDSGFGTDLLVGGLPYGDGQMFFMDDYAFFEGGGENYL